MQLGNDEEALASFKIVLTSNPDPDIAQQAYYQLATVYRRLHRLDEAKAALAQFENLKQQSNEHQQQLYEKKRKIQETDRESPAQQPGGTPCSRQLWSGKCPARFTDANIPSIRLSVSLLWPSSCRARFSVPQTRTRTGAPPKKAPPSESKCTSRQRT